MSELDGSIHGQRDPITPAMTETDPLEHGAHHDRSCACWQRRPDCGCYLWDRDCPHFTPPADDEREVRLQSLRTALFPWSADQSTEACNLIRELLDEVAGFRRQGPPTDDEREALIDDLNSTVEWLKRTRSYIDADRVMRAIAALRRQGPIIDDPNRVALFNPDGSARPLDEVRSEGARKRAALEPQGGA